MSNHNCMAIAVLVTLLCACGNQPPGVEPYQFNIGTHPLDFSTGTSAEDAIYVYWLAGGLDDTGASEADAYFREHLRVYSIDTALRISGETRVGFWTMGGTELAEPLRVPRGQEGYSFIPTSSLVDGWYIAAIDLAGWRTSHLITSTSDDVIYVRFQVGSTPVWYETTVDTLTSEEMVVRLIGPQAGTPLSALSHNPFRCASME